MRMHLTQDEILVEIETMLGNSPPRAFSLLPIITAYANIISGLLRRGYSLRKIYLAMRKKGVVQCGYSGFYNAWRQYLESAKKADFFRQRKSEKKIAFHSRQRKMSRANVNRSLSGKTLRNPDG